MESNRTTFFLARRERVLVEEVESKTQSSVSIVVVAASKAVVDAELTILLLATSEVAGKVVAHDSNTFTEGGKLKPGLKETIWYLSWGKNSKLG